MNQNSGKPRILIVDDAPENVWSLIRNLETEYEVLYATGGKKALEIVFSGEPPDLILLDIIMPEMDGYEVIRKLKEKESGRDIPVIFLTARSEEEDETRGLRSGAWDYVTKPFRMPVVKARIQSVLNLKKEMDRRLFLKQQMEFLNVQLEKQVQEKIKELKSARAALQANEERYRILFEKKHLSEDDPKTVLIVDDNPENIHVLSKNLEENYEVLYATSGEKALEIAFSDENPDLILLDIMMPGMDGYEVCARLKANAETWDIPVIFLTAMSQVQDETRGLEMGAADYISKPFSMPVVRARISAALRLKTEMDKRLMLTRRLQDLNRELEKRVSEKVAELRLVHEELKSSENKYRSIFENAVEGIYQSTIEGRFISASPSMSLMLGYESPEDMISSVRDIGEQCYVNPDERKELIRMLSEKGVAKGFETRMKKKDGSPIWCVISSRLVRDEAGRAVYSEGFCIDISRQRQAEEALLESELRLRQAQKMEAIGALASGIAHDFNNILSPIMGYTELSISCLPAESRERSFMEEVFKAALRARGLVDQILSFSRQAERVRHPFSVQTVVREVVKLLKSAFPSTIEIIQDIRSDSLISADPVEIHQVLMNLCTNAFHAMQGKGGELRIILRDGDREHPEFPLWNPESFPHVVLEISDTGYGMDPKILERIFEPYFTTKSKGEGTGLGLATVHGIVEDLKGHIAVKSEDGRGSTFTVCFPAFVSDAGIPEEYAEPEIIPRGNEHILLTDDEEQICEMMCEILEGIGYRITSHTSAPDALKDFQAAPDDFDILLTDMTMPKLTGLELAAQVMAIRPDFPVIILSGFSSALDKEDAQNLGIREFVMKPVIRADIAQAIRRALESERAKKGD